MSTFIGMGRGPLICTTCNGASYLVSEDGRRKMPCPLCGNKPENLFPAVMVEYGVGIVARPLSEWHEGDGDVLWWRFPVREAPYVGSPLDLGKAYQIRGIGESVTVHLGGWPGYHTHWTPLPAPPTAPTLLPDCTHCGNTGLAQVEGNIPDYCFSCGRKALF